MVDRGRFGEAFKEFRDLYANYGGRPFTNFQEGFAATWEGYKPRVRAEAIRRLAADRWTAADIGTGSILETTISAIEIVDPVRNLNNNLVFWPNRFGHATRDHAALLEAREIKGAKTKIERVVFDLYVGEVDEAGLFDELSRLVRRKYPLVAYLFFIKDDRRFMPLQPTGFDRALSALGIDLVTRGNCSFINYTSFNRALGEVAIALQEATGLDEIRLIDAHSFCWIYATLLKQKTLQPNSRATGGSFGRHADPGSVLGPRERSILDMKYSVLQTTDYARGQQVERSVQIKSKTLGFDPHALEAHLRELMVRQEDRCALTGIRFNFADERADENLLPSLDRIDSQGHYERGNLQVVCRFANFWKGAMPDAEFRRLLALVRAGGDDEGCALTPGAGTREHAVSTAPDAARELYDA